MKKALSFSSSLLAGLCMMLALLLLSLLVISYMPPIYEMEYDKLGQAEVIGTSREQLRYITGEVIRYIAGFRHHLDITATIGGVERAVFNEREIAHMVDVQNLFLLGQKALLVSAFAAIVLGILGRILLPKESRKWASGGFLCGVALFFGLVGGLVCAAVIDFTTVFTKFHLLFFTNDLWLLDPRTDVLIQMVPEQFFRDICVFIAILFVVLTAVALVLLIRLYVRDRKATPAAEAPAFEVETIHAHGDTRVRIEHAVQERPDAESIFENFGLDDSDDEQELIPEQEPEIPTVLPKEEAPAAAAVPVPVDLPAITAVAVPATDNTQTVTVPVNIPAEVTLSAEHGMRLEIRLILQMPQNADEPIPVEVPADKSAPIDSDEDMRNRMENLLRDL